MASIFGRGVSAYLFFFRTDSEVGSSSPLLCGGRTDGAATASYHIGRGIFDLGIFYFSMLQARVLFETFFGVEGVESSPRSCAKEFRHLGWAPLFYHNPVSQVGTYSRSAGQLQVFVQACRTPSSVRQQRFNCYHARIYHTPKHTLWVFGRAITPSFYHPPLIYHTPKHTLWVFGCPITPPGLSHPPWAPCELHFFTRGTQDITPPTGYHTRL